MKKILKWSIIVLIIITFIYIGNYALNYFAGTIVTDLVEGVDCDDEFIQLIEEAKESKDISFCHEADIEQYLVAGDLVNSCNYEEFHFYNLKDKGLTAQACAETMVEIIDDKDTCDSVDGEIKAACLFRYIQMNNESCDSLQELSSSFFELCINAQS